MPNTKRLQELLLSIKSRNGRMEMIRTFRALKEVRRELKTVTMPLWINLNNRAGEEWTDDYYITNTEGWRIARANKPLWIFD
jgi:hypothetical protein